jgi:hypothetical protein
MIDGLITLHVSWDLNSQLLAVSPYTPNDCLLCLVIYNMGCWKIDRCVKTLESLRMVWHLFMGLQPRCQIEALSVTYWWHTWIVPARSFLGKIHDKFHKCFSFWEYKIHWLLLFSVCLSLEMERYFNCVQ